MPRHCEVFNIPPSDAIPGGIKGIMCYEGPRHKPPKPCYICGEPSSKLCDYLEPGRVRTCDRPLCEKHAMHPDPEKDLDYCPQHWQLLPKKE